MIFPDSPKAERKVRRRVSLILTRKGKVMKTESLKESLMES
jgi:hypothetical protein